RDCMRMCMGLHRCKDGMVCSVLSPRRTSAASLSEHEVEDAHDGALVGLGQRADALELLLNLRGGPAVADFAL
ncbi:MAG TPA: hypothetical protein VFY97_09970, partial [Rhodanobacteraceae bacterium]|nr:hypothetical protein [Rhodanobacteraceae bacterium]